MKHLIVCPEFPPARHGGIGIYVEAVSRLLAERGETVHVVGARWQGATDPIERRLDGRLVVHRLPYMQWRSLLPRRPHRGVSREARRLFDTEFFPQAFAWDAARMIEEIVDREEIDVIEGQEFEAPLYYFLLRRALGDGPDRQPPVIVHLHSPTEEIVASNDWPLSRPYFLTAKRLEDYCIAAADALLSPSRFLARTVEEAHRLRPDSIEVIRYPLGTTPLLERNDEVWADGSITYLGRLEPRKGVLEWLDAAVATARADPNPTFRLVGENVLGDDLLTSRRLLHERIPPDLRPRFVLHGWQSRQEVMRLLGRSRMLAVPSRWDNFPNSCLEAMASGLPVLATRRGGMAEIITDGETGWLAEDARPEALRALLERALATAPERLAQMGRRAAADVRAACDNAMVTESQLEFKRRVVESGAGRSATIPVARESRRTAPAAPAQSEIDPGKTGVAVVIQAFGSAAAIAGCVESLCAQTLAPRAVVVLGDGSRDERIRTAIERLEQAAVPALLRPGTSDVAIAWNHGVAALKEAQIEPLAIVCMTADDRLEPGLVATTQSVLQRLPHVGLVSFWVEVEGSKWPQIRPHPALPFQWLANDAAPFAAIRLDAWIAAGGFRGSFGRFFAMWEACAAILADGWTAVTLPEMLGRCGSSTAASWPPISSLESRRALVERFSSQISDQAGSLLLLTSLDTESLVRDGQIGPRRRLDLIRLLLGELGSISTWLARTSAVKLRRLLGRDDPTRSGED